MSEEYAFPWHSSYVAKDLGKPEAIPQVIDYFPNGHSQIPTTSNIEFTGPPSINEAENVEAPKDRRGDNVW